MYLQIKIRPGDCRYLRFLWRTDGKVEVYQFNRLVIGLNTSPFIAHHVVQEHARQHSDLQPRAAEAMLQSTYMDDSLDSVDGVDSCIELYRQLSELWSSAGMKARKWLSNSQQVLEEIPKEDQVSAVDISTGDLPSTKTLGVKWIAKEDQFAF